MSCLFTDNIKHIEKYVCLNVIVNTLQNIVHSIIPVNKELLDDNLCTVRRHVQDSEITFSDKIKYIQIDLTAVFTDDEFYESLNHKYVGGS
jgi:hypothetical protein